MRRFRSYPLGVRLVLTAYAIAFLIGTATHVRNLLQGYSCPHHPLLNGYWSALTLADPLTVALLLLAPRPGLLLAAGIMLTDVAINSTASYLYLDADGRYAVDSFVQLQSAFLGFLLGSAPFVWTHLASRGRSRVVQTQAL